MKITDLHVDGFGVWKGLSLGDLPDSLTVFYGRNEAGKTTLMQFVRAVFYGFSPERRERYLPPLHGEAAGGTLRCAAGGKQYDVRRQLLAGDSSSSPGELVVSSESGAREGQSRLAALLAGIDESIFNNVFAVGLREMQELATLNDTAAAEQLYRLTGGLDRVSLVDVMRELEASRRRLLASEDRPSQILQLRSQAEKLQGEIEELASLGGRWSQLITHRDALRQDIADQEQTATRLERQTRQLETALAVRERWNLRASLVEQLAAIGPLAPLPENAVERLDLYGSRLATRLEQSGKLREQQALLRREAAKLTINRPLWAQASRIEALSEHLPWMTSLTQQIETLRSEVSQCDKELGVCFEQMGASQPASLASLPDVSKKKLEMLREPARAIVREQRSLTEAQELHARATRDGAEAQTELETALLERDHTDLTTALEEAGDRTGKLRRRIQLEERIDQLLRRRDNLEEDALDMRENQVLPLHILGAIGAVFIVGVMLILTGFFGGIFWAVTNSTMWAVFGCLLSGGAVAAKYLLERRAAEKLIECNDQMASLKKQLEQAQRDRDELDRDLPSGGGALDSRLRDAERELETLESLLPLDSKRKEAEARAKLAEAASTEAEAALKTARNRWRGALRSIGLPESLSPRQAQQFARGCGRTARLRRKREARLDEFRQRERELQTLAARILQLMQEAGLKPTNNDPQVQLRQLISAVAEQRATVEKRAGLRKQYRTLRREQMQHRQSAENLRRRKQALIAAAGAEDEQQLRQFAELHHRVLSLARQRDEASTQISLVLAGQFSEEVIGSELDEFGGGLLESRRDELASELQKVRERLTQMHERRGEMNHELKALVADRRLAEAQLELGCVRQRLQEAVRQWQVLAVAGRLLESIRALYETERQPETLSEASRYLSKLTEGKYTRIWTPLGEQVLKIDDERGDPLPLDVLSSGTREAVFLSLRLALAAAYARRGAALPLVLDDVLVNFDTERAKAAANVLAEFARGGFQMLLFTCHEHIVRIFRNARVEVRLLPGRGQVVEALPVDEDPVVELPPARKKKRKASDEPVVEPAPLPVVELVALPPPSVPVPPPLPVRLAQPVPVVEGDTHWRDPLWLDDALGAEPFESDWLNPPEPEIELDIWAEETVYDDEPTVEVVVEDEEPEFLYDDWYYEEPKLYDEPAVKSVVVESPAPPPVKFVRYERRFAWESPEMYWEGEQTERAA